MNPILSRDLETSGILAKEILAKLLFWNRVLASWAFIYLWNGWGTHNRQNTAASALADIGAGSLELGGVGNGDGGCDNQDVLVLALSSVTG